MPTAASSLDWNNFVKAAEQFGGKVGISRAIQIRLRDWSVEAGLLNAGTVGEIGLYSAAISSFLNANISLEREKTAEEIAAEAAAAKLAEARRNMGVVNYEDRPVRKLTDEAINTNRAAQHNAAVDQRMNRFSDAQERREATQARMTLPDAIPGLVDETFNGNSVYVGGRVARYATSQAVEKAKAHNAQVRAKYAEQQSQASAAAAANSKRGI